MSPYTASYTSAFCKLMQAEGVYSNNTNDPGGETMYGISKRSWPEMWVRGPPSLAEAKAFYYREYWQKLRATSLPAGSVRLELFDTAVNFGKNKAVKIMQKAYNELSEYYRWVPLIEDGIIGGKTIRAVGRWCNHSDSRMIALAVLMNNYQVNHYRTRRHRGQFLVGWLAKRGRMT